MCFSAKVSFITSALLASIGILNIRQIQERSQILFASIPLMFFIQQFSEGIIWVTKSSILKSIMAYIFLSFAFIIWPIFIPLSLFKLEENLTRKKLLITSILLGIIWAIFFSYIIFSQNIKAIAACNHIYYQFYTPFYHHKILGLFIYNLLTVIPFFISSRKSMWLFGTLLGLSCIISYIFWYNFLTSVWCFFVAVLSLLTYFIIKWQNIKANYLKIIAQCDYKDIY